MTKEQRILLKQYRELKELSGDNNIELSDKLNTKYLKTLEFLVKNKHIQVMDVGSGSMYIKSETFDDFEENYIDEIGEQLPNIFALYSRVDDLRGKFRFANDGYMISGNIIYNNSEFISWKSEVIYELRKLVNNDTVNELIDIFNSFNGLAEENKFAKCSSLLKVVIDNYDDFIINETNSSSDLEGNDKMYEKIFISHRSSDKKCGDAIVKLFKNLGLRNEQIIYTSHPLYKIPNGENICDYLKENISQKIFCLFILSDEYFKSAVCLNEMGAFWVTQSDYQCSFVPKFDFDNYSFKNCVIDSGKIGFRYVDESMSNTSLIQFKNSIIEKFGLPKPTDDEWEYMFSEYKDEISKICN